jgi:chromosome partitioning protein
MKIMAVINQKGGVGKTTTSINMAVGFVRAGKRVLLIDADLQGNATIGLGLEAKQLRDGACDLFALLTNACQFSEALLERAVLSGSRKYRLHVLPATIALSGFDQVVRALPNKQMLLKQMLQEYVHDYDYVVIDCPPSLGLMALNALNAADEVLIPVQPEFFALQGISQLLDTIALLQKGLNPHLKIGGIICTRFNRRKIHNEVFSCLHDKFPTQLLATRIHENIALAEAPSYGKTIFEYAPGCSGAYDYDLLVKEFLNKEIRQTPIIATQAKNIQNQK